MNNKLTHARSAVARCHLGPPPPLLRRHGSFMALTREDRVNCDQIRARARARALISVTRRSRTCLARQRSHATSTVSRGVEEQRRKNNRDSARLRSIWRPQRLADLEQRINRERQRAFAANFTRRVVATLVAPDYTIPCVSHSWSKKHFAFQSDSLSLFLLFLISFITMQANKNAS